MPAKNKPVKILPGFRHMTKIRSVVYHRNGVGGEPFYAVTFDSDIHRGTLIGIVFNTDDDGDRLALKASRRPVAVLDTKMLGRGTFRGDNFTSDLVKAVQNFEDKEKAKFERAHVPGYFSRDH